MLSKLQTWRTVHNLMTEAPESMCVAPYSAKLQGKSGVLRSAESVATTLTSSGEHGGNARKYGGLHPQKRWPLRQAGGSSTCCPPEYSAIQSVTTALCQQESV